MRVILLSYVAWKQYFRAVAIISNSRAWFAFTQNLL